ncbi:leucyl aminopeptidase family protein [Demequina silvatica]|uniref:leucyl aminopeptidase family protein n=1 Tax=Demequina silvatica TaxID=1638988 RepID=UPI000784526D|nr:leucyl aminopeptidase [Demequina silvatica]
MDAPLDSSASAASTFVDALARVPATAPGELDTGPIAYIVSSASPAGATTLDAAALAGAGFTGAAGTSLVVPAGERPVVLAGAGASPTANAVRDAAAVAARAVARVSDELTVVVDVPGLEPAAVAVAAAEGAILGRYRFQTLTTSPKDRPLARVGVVVAGAPDDAVAEGISAALPWVRAALTARDLGNAPASILTATRMAEAAKSLGPRFGFEVEAYGPDALRELGCGGLLGVNAGSAEEPRMIVLRYSPAGEPTGHLGMVGKGIMYDSGGISLKPSDPMHLLMKIDMGGAAAVLGAFTALRDLGTTARVSAWLMCTDNMPSGTATKLGDVLVARGGTTVEVKNTDAEGRLVMMDGLVLATEDGVDAVVDIATLTGAALMALGKSRAALFANDDALAGRVEAAAAAVDEPVWRLPLEAGYREQLDSQVADIANLGGPHAGATTAALFLQEFVGETPWAHVDIAGTMQAEKDQAWRPAGATGYGARLLAHVASGFAAAG